MSHDAQERASGDCDGDGDVIIDYPFNIEMITKDDWTIEWSLESGLINPGNLGRRCGRSMTDAVVLMTATGRTNEMDGSSFLSRCHQLMSHGFHVTRSASRRVTAEASK